MSSEFKLLFKDDNWRAANLDALRQQISGLETFSGCHDDIQFRLLGTEPRHPGSWSHDVRLFLEKEHIFMEITAHPPSIEADLSALFAWLRARTDISIVDDDGLPSGW